MSFDISMEFLGLNEMQKEIERAVVPGYYLVCYNQQRLIDFLNHAVVPGYYLVCYN